MKKPMIIFVLLAQLLRQTAFAQGSASAEANPITFEGGAKQPKPFKAFELSEPDGSAVPLTKEGILSMPGNIKDDAKKEASEAFDKMKTDGFDRLEAISEKAFEPIKTTAGQYLDEFNKSEEKLNKLGYTLREGGKAVVNEVQKIDVQGLKNQVVEAGEVYIQDTLEDLKKRKEEMEQKLIDLENQAMHSLDLPKEGDKEGLYLNATADKCGQMNPGASTVTGQDVGCFIKDEIKQPESPLLSPEPETCKADTPLGKAYLVNESWADGGGDKNFGWNADAQFKLTTDAAGISSIAQTKVNALLIGKSKPVLEASANFTAPRKGNATSVRSIAIFGNKVSSKNETFSTNLATSKNEKGEETLIQRQDQPIFSQTFMLGFVPVLVKIDTRYSIGPRYALDIVPVKLVGKVEWVTKFTVIASAGVGADLKLFLILAGIKGYIDVLNTTVGAYPEAGLYLDEKNRPQIGARLSALAEMVTLSGQLDIGVWAKSTFSVPQPRKSFPFVEFKPLSYEWKQTIGKYPGYTFPTATLFDQKVGYDVCSGRKQVDVLTANTPRPRDERESLAVREGVRVSKLETDFRGIVDSALFGDEAIKLDQSADSLVRNVASLDSVINSTAMKVFGKTLAVSSH